MQFGHNSGNAIRCEAGVHTEKACRIMLFLSFQQAADAVAPKNMVF